MDKKEKTKNEFLFRINENKSIKYKDIKKDNSSLLYAIERHFGGIFNISKESGFSEEDLVNNYGLTRNINHKVLTDSEIFDCLTHW